MRGHDRVPTREDTDVVFERIGALFIDALLVGMLAFAIVMVWSAIGVGAGDPEGYGDVGGLMALGAMASYFLGLEGIWDGQTVGKKLFGIKVVGVDGTECGIQESVSRNLTKLIDWAVTGYIATLVFIATSDRSQRLGDRMADTVVVEEPPETGRRRSGHDQRARHPDDRYERDRSRNRHGEGRSRDRYGDERGRNRHDEGRSRDHYDDPPRRRHGEAPRERRPGDGRYDGESRDRRGDRSRERFGDEWDPQGPGPAPDESGRPDRDSSEEVTDDEEWY